ncbi:MAG: TasA family protein [Parcubacteria group bacterium]
MKRIRASAKKIGLALFVLFLIANLNKVHPTDSAFTDTETSAGNNFIAGTFDLELDSSVLMNISDFRAGDAVVGSVKAKNAGSADLQYKLNFRKISGDDTLCHGLQLEADKNGSLAYSGALDGLNFNAGNLASGHSDEWDFDVSLPSTAPPGLEGLQCKFSFVFSAWQAELPDGSSGFSDSDDFSENLIGSGDWTVPVILDNDIVKVAGTKGTTNGTQPKAIVTWHTNEMATSNVVYDASSSHPSCSAYAFQSPMPADTSADNIAHSVELPNLTAGTTYYYKIQTSDASGNEKCSTSHYFTVPVSVSDSPTGNIVLNEIVPNPSGNEAGPMPGGEWVEIYNKGTTSADDMELAGWTIYDHTLAGGVAITSINTNTGATTLTHGAWLAVYMNKSYLSNDSDTVYLYNGAKGDAGVTLVDSHVWTASIPDDKSIARFPDGTGPWIDPENTPGEENKLGEKELAQFRTMTLEKCFDAEGKVKKSKEDVCQPEFLVYLGMLGNKKDKMMDKDMRDKLLEPNSPPNQEGDTTQISNGEKSDSDIPPTDGDVNPPAIDEPKIISKEFDINLKGKLNAPDGFEASADQKLQKIKLSCEESVINDLKDFEIDLAKVKIDKVGKIEILVSDLNLPKDVDLVTAKKDDTVVLITTSEKPKEEPKKEEIKKADADLPKADSLKDDPKKDDSGGNGDSSTGRGSDPASKSVDSAEA